MKKIFTLSLVAVSLILSLCSCSKKEVFPDSLATDATHLWVCIGEGNNPTYELAINESNYCILRVVPKTGDPDVYDFSIMYDNTTGNGAVIDVATVGGVSGNIIAAEGSKKSAISARFSQVISGGSQLIFQGVMTYEAIKID